MGLSDIDEDEPATQSPARPIILGAPAAAAVPTAKVTATVASHSGSPLTASPHVRDNRYNSNNNNNATNSTASTSASGASVLDDLFGNTNFNDLSSPERDNASPTSVSPTNLSKPTPTTKTAPNVLDDLFSAPATTTSSASAGAAGKASPTSKTQSETHAVLYVDGTSAGVKDDGTNLFDLSKPAKKEKYNNAESFLDMFERQGKKGGARSEEGETLGSLTRNKDDNKVRARLLALMNYYDVLGVAQTASEEEIKRSYKKKALELHPDRVGRGQTQEEAELFKVITKAHEVLTDAEQRRQYDASLTGGQPAAASANDWWSHVNM